jgi:putative DNA primase/helicase
MSAAMFDPLPSGATTPPRTPEWRVIMPAPEDAPAPPATHPKLGRPSIRWEYRDGAGRLNGYVCRFERVSRSSTSTSSKTRSSSSSIEGSGKEIRSLVFAEHKRWGRQWRWLGFPKPRPLYGIDRLMARPEAPVIVTEGEKAADSGALLLPDYVVVTSPGGSKAAKAADWSAIAGHPRAVIWRDADAAGEAYARDVCEMLAKLSPAPAVAIVKPPAGMPEGWDAADALAQRWTPAQAAELIKSAAAVSAEPASPAAPKPNARDRVIDLLAAAELWHDPERIAFATVPVDSHYENHEIGSNGFKDWLASRAYEATGSVPAAEAIEAALRVARTQALRGLCHRTWRRFAEHGGRIYLDLGCPRWRAVEIAATGWHLVDTVPVKFLRSRGMLTLPEPEAGEVIELLREFVNVESDADFRLFVAVLAAAMRPSGPFVILAVTGPAGSSKSTLAKIMVLLIDPKTPPSTGAPRDERDLFVSASNSWLLSYTNLSSIQQWLSDALCRLADGEGFKIRQLQTDRDEMIFSGARPIVVNGIGNLAKQPDLADRTLSLMPPPLSDDQRREEREFWGAFEAARPKILGALCDIVAGGLRRLPDLKLDRLPRRADFARWGAACAPGWGSDAAEFLADYEENRSEAMVAAAEASLLLPLIEAVLARTGLDAAGFDGTATELLKRLDEVCGEAERKQQWFPKTASQLGGALNRIAPLLRLRRIEFQRYKVGRGRDRRIALRCASEAVRDELRARVMGQPRGAGDQPAR